VLDERRGNRPQRRGRAAADDDDDDDDWLYAANAAFNPDTSSLDCTTCVETLPERTRYLRSKSIYY
jgi:hypothetical protein